MVSPKGRRGALAGLGVSPLLPSALGPGTTGSRPSLPLQTAVMPTREAPLCRQGPDQAPGHGESDDGPEQLPHRTL